MKKLMFVAAAALCASVFAAAIESSNIVGYAQNNLQTGFTMATSQFLPVTGTGISLESIVPNRVNAVTIQLLSSAGVMVQSYQYMDWAGPDYDQTAWADLDGNIAENVVFAPGQGLWIQAAESTDAITTAGAVGFDDVTVSLRAGFTAVGNPFPVAIPLQDIVASQVNTTTIQLLSPAGVMLESYQYMDWAGPDYNQTAWADLDGNIAEDVVIQPGQGLWIQAASTEDSITFPAPEL